MNEKQIKRKLEDKGVKVVDLAARLCQEFNITRGSADVMLRQLISGQRWYPTYADWLKTNYGITVDKPSSKSVRERLKQAV